MKYYTKTIKKSKRRVSKTNKKNKRRVSKTNKTSKMTNKTKRRIFGGDNTSVNEIKLTDAHIEELQRNTIQKMSEIFGVTTHDLLDAYPSLNTSIKNYLGQQKTIVRRNQGESITAAEREDYSKELYNTTLETIQNALFGRNMDGSPVTKNRYELLLPIVKTNVIADGIIQETRGMHTSLDTSRGSLPEFFEPTPQGRTVSLPDFFEPMPEGRTGILSQPLEEEIDAAETLTSLRGM